MTKHLTPVWSSFLQSVSQSISSSGALAMNVLGPASGPTVIPQYPVYSGVQHWWLEVPIRLPASTVSLTAIYLYIDGPTGTGEPTRLIGGPFFGPFTAGSALTLNSDDLGPNAATDTNYTDVKVGVVNSSNVQTPGPYTTGPFTVSGYGSAGGGSLPTLPTGVTVAVVYQTDAFGNLQFQINGTFTPPSDPTFYYVNVGLRPSTALSTAISSTSATACRVIGSVGFRNGDTIQIDAEQMTLTSGIGIGTTLAAALSIAGTSVSVTSNAGFANGNTIEIDSEIMLLSSGAGTNTWTVTRTAGVAHLPGATVTDNTWVVVRGVNGTTAATHLITANVMDNNVGLPVSIGNVLNTVSWTGIWENLIGSISVNVEVFAVNKSLTQSTAYVLVTPQTNAALNLSLTHAATGINGGSTTVGAEIPNCVMTSGEAVYSITSGADGIEQYQFVATGVTPSDPRFATAQAIACPICYIAGYNGTVGLTIPAVSTASPTAFNVYVKPYAIPATCTVGSDGVSISAISLIIYPGLAGNFVIIAGIIYQVLNYVSANSLTLIAGSNATPGTNVAFLSIECRYGMSVGDIVQIDNEQFTLTGPQAGWILDEVQVIGGVGVTGWVLTTIVGQTATTHVTSSGTKVMVDVISSAGNVDDYAGSLNPGLFQSVSPLLPIGTPTAYILYLVSLSTLGVFNTWPVVGITPFEIIGAVEVRTPGSLRPSRLTPTELHYDLAVFNGKLQTVLAQTNMVPNGSFETGMVGSAPPGWTNVGGFVGVPNGNWFTSNISAMNGSQSLGITANGGVICGPQPCSPGQQFGMQCSVFATTGTSGGSTITMILGFLNTAGVFVGGNQGTQATASAIGAAWQREPVTANALITATAPATAASVYVGFVIAGLTAGGWLIDNVTLQLLISGNALQVVAGGVAGGQTIGSDPFNNVILLDQSVKQQHVANQAIAAAQMVLNTITAKQLAANAAANNITANTLNANTVIAPNGVFTALAALNATVVGQITTQSLAATQGVSFVQINQDGISVQVTNTSTGDIVDLSNGVVTCLGPGQLGYSYKGIIDAESLTLSSINPVTVAGFGASLVASFGAAFLDLTSSIGTLIPNFVQAQASTAGAWFCPSCNTLDAGAPTGSFAYYTGTGHAGRGFYVMSATLVSGGPGWFLTLAD